jgi:hypothetical protein
MKNYYKDINYVETEGSKPYVKVNESDVGAQLGNDGNYYVLKDIVDSSYPDGDYWLIYFVDDFFVPIPDDGSYNELTNVQLVEDAVDEHTYNILIENWYKDIGEVAAMAINAESKWQDEAIALNDWYNQVYELLDKYKVGNTIMTPEEFIETLPIFAFNG